MSCHRNVVYTKALLDLRLSAAHGMVYWIIQGLILWMSSVRYSFQFISICLWDNIHC